MKLKENKHWVWTFLGSAVHSLVGQFVFDLGWKSDHHSSSISKINLRTSVLCWTIKLEPVLGDMSSNSVSVLVEI